MTRREAMFALAALFALVICGATWLFGPIGLIGTALSGALIIIFGVERADEPHDEAVPGALSDAIEALRRDLPL